MKYLLLLALPLLIFSCDSEKGPDLESIPDKGYSIVGSWYEVGKDPAKELMVFREDGFVDIIRYGEYVSGDSVVNGDITGTIKYRFDRSIRPMGLDVIRYNHIEGEVTMKFITQFIDENQMLLKFGGNERPKDFIDDGTEESELYLRLK